MACSLPKTSYQRDGRATTGQALRSAGQTGMVRASWAVARGQQRRRRRRRRLSQQTAQSVGRAGKLARASRSAANTSNAQWAPATLALAFQSGRPLARSLARSLAAAAGASLARSAPEEDERPTGCRFGLRQQPKFARPVVLSVAWPPFSRLCARPPARPPARSGRPKARWLAPTSARPAAEWQPRRRRRTQHWSAAAARSHGSLVRAAGVGPSAPVRQAERVRALGVCVAAEGSDWEQEQLGVLPLAFAAQAAAAAASFS